MATSIGPSTDPAPSSPGIHVHFPNGLPGFEELRQFQLLPYSHPFELLVSEQDPEIGFFLIDPRLLVADYAPELPEADLRELGANVDLATVVMRAIVTVGDDAASTTANLAAPLLLNLEAGLACQAILEDNRYSIRTPLTAPQGGQTAR